MAKKGEGLFLVYTDLIDPKHEEEFNAWYNTEHLPELLSLPGFLDAARYVATRGGPKYLAAYELTSPEALQTPEFSKRKRTPWENRMSPRVTGKNVTRIVGRQIFPSTLENPDRGMAPALQIGRMSVPESADAEWNEWYDSEYIPEYLKVPGVIYARRYRAVDGERSFATVYELVNDKVSESADWSHQREHSSPRSGRMREQMTMGPGSPGVYRRIFPQQNQNR
jgi:hypothetical protein